MNTATPRLKVCCIASIEEADLAVRYGANAIGLVGDMPSGPGIVTNELAREIAAAIPPGVDSFVLTSHTTACGIAAHVEECHPNTVQIVQHIDPAEYPELIERLPGTRRVQVIHVEDRTALELIERYEPFVHAFLLDSGRPSADIPELGGTGRPHDWAISAEFVRRSSRPVFLAGGLDPGNVAEAIRTVKPYGVDLCSGIRIGTRDGPYPLDEQLLSRFAGAITNPAGN